MIWEPKGCITSLRRCSGAGYCEPVGRHLCNFISTFHFIMSTEEGEAGPAGGGGGGEARGGTSITHRHTWEEEGCQGRRHPEEEEEDEAEQGQEEDGEGCREARGCRDACEGDNGGEFGAEDGAVGGSACKAQTMHSNCSSETCIPTPSCRICFQGAEQVTAPPTCSHCVI